MNDIGTQKLAGKCALVTGASRGIGRAIAQRLAAEGATVVVTARSLGSTGDVAGTLAETVALIESAGGRAIALAADLTDAVGRDALVERAAQAAGGLDILINNAGVADYECVDQMPMEMFERTFDHYLRIPFALAQAAIPLMRSRGAGWIVNVGSVTALPPLRPYDDFARAGGATVYAAVKAALSRFTQGLAAELEADGIAVNLVAPSTAIRTPGAARYIPEGYPTEDVAYLAETALAFCLLPARERTGVIAHSLHFPLANALQVRSLDGRTVLPPPTVPAYAHPHINPKGA
ncbi:SDR family NAD(P)-dependent oxidoreductase [Paraburkholderia silviterrae]|uniref:SDR family NAD(P)-dependent oxidoreductase n=1 Tax=Paraburkholderia silviterrae TaxID=2528715 RepID=A0A4R5M364_9BURK|nr:SDR family NAD(P)-dependent oxidoreductase [Paraburkholderia silviterrae]TDG20068.1 SDR family NAD(P)-dependent oxidoreductase [Paraburkholderia silviterrae]